MEIPQRITDMRLIMGVQILGLDQQQLLPLTPYLDSLEASIGEQNSSIQVHQRPVSFRQVDVGDVLAEVLPGQELDGGLVVLQGVLDGLVALAVLRAHHQQSSPPVGDISGGDVRVKLQTSSQQS